MEDIKNGWIVRSSDTKNITLNEQLLTISLPTPSGIMNKLSRKSMTFFITSCKQKLFFWFLNYHRQCPLFNYHLRFIFLVLSLWNITLISTLQSYSTFTYFSSLFFQSMRSDNGVLENIDAVNKFVISLIPKITFSDCTFNFFDVKKDNYLNKLCHYMHIIRDDESRCIYGKTLPLRSIPQNSESLILSFSILQSTSN